jgi:hypothetical protein
MMERARVVGLLALQLLWGCNWALPYGVSAGDVGAPPDGPVADVVVFDLGLAHDRQGTDTGGCGDSVGPSGVVVHYRSIGTHQGPLHATGNASVAEGSTAVTFSDPLSQNVGRGDRINFGGGEERFVRSRDSAHQVTLQTPSFGGHADTPVKIYRAFDSLQAWEDAQEGDLVGEQRIEVGVCFNDGPFTSPLLIEGSVTDPTHFLHLTVAPGQRHSGRAGTGAVLKPGVPGHGIEIRDNYTRVEWLEITGWGANTNTTAFSLDGINIAADGVLVDHVIVHHDEGRAHDNPDCNGITVEADNVSATVRNTIVHNLARSAVTIHKVKGARLTLQNVTVWSCTEHDDLADYYGCVGLREAPSSEILAENVIAMGALNSGVDFFNNYSGPWDPASRNNLSSDGTAPGAQPWTSQSAGLQFVDLTPGSEDLHLKAGASAIGAGVDLSDQFCDDVDGQIRPVGGAWAVGADEP